jgi:hypothetical protein
MMEATGSTGRIERQHEVCTQLHVGHGLQALHVYCVGGGGSAGLHAINNKTLHSIETELRWLLVQGRLLVPQFQSCRLVQVHVLLPLALAACGVARVW